MPSDRPGGRAASGYIMREWTEKADLSDGGRRLDVFWQGCLDEEGVPRARIQDWIRQGRAAIDGRVCVKPGTRLVPGQTLELSAEESEGTITPVEGALAVLHADGCLAVIDKPAGLTVHPAPSVRETTLVHLAAHRFPALLDQGGERPGIVHRLDKDTSGLIVLALHDASRRTLTRMFGDRDVYKEYLALVAGVPAPGGTVSAPVGRHPVIKTRMAVTAGGRPAETRFRRLWTATDRSASLVRVRILTGRTHQIRVHMAHIGHPLLGDRLYAEKSVAGRAPRQMLHAWQLRLAHPESREKLSFFVPPPADFMAVLERLCRDRTCVGLTGAAGGGKSAVGRFAAELGVPVFCADRAVADSYAPGGAGSVIIAHHLGGGFLDPDGGVDKAALLAAMRASDSLRREVERLVHPLVRESLAAFMAAPGPDLRLAEIPLLCEAGLAESVDLTVAVFRPDEARHAHLHERGWDAERIGMMDSWQWPQEKKLRMAHLVLDNSGSLEDLRRRTKSLLRAAEDISRGRARRRMDRLTALFEHPDTMDESELTHVSPAR